MEEIDSSKINNVKQTAMKTTIFVMLVTFGAKIVGYVRELVLAGVYGTSYVVDAYIMSQSIPYMILGGVISAAATTYIPLLSEKIEKHSEKEGNAFTGQVLDVLSSVLMVVSIIGIVFSEQLTGILASGFTGETARLTSLFLKITFIYTVFWARSRILDAYSQYKGVFVPQIIYGYVQNIVIIIAIIVSAYYEVYILVLGFLLGYVIYYLLVYVTARRCGYKYYKNGINTTIDAIKEIGKLALPVFIGSEVNTVNAFVDKWLASRLGEGSVAALSYAYEIQVLIISFTSAIYVTVVYPQLARAGNSNDRRSFCAIVEKGTRIITMLVVPCMLGAILFSEPIVRLIYERGAFDTSATGMTSSAFAFYSMGIVFLAFNALFTRIFYALKDVKTPVRYGMVGVVINIILNFVLVNYMYHNGLALSTSIAAGWNTIMLYRALRKKYPWIVITSEMKKVLSIIFAALISVGTAYGIFKLILSIGMLSEWICLIAAIGICIIIYALLLILCKIEEAEMIKKNIYNWINKNVETNEDT